MVKLSEKDGEKGIRVYNRFVNLFVWPGFVGACKVVQNVPACAAAGAEGRPVDVGTSRHLFLNLGFWE
jgi:hypothetical protein